jgi:hypothetical protein
VKFVILKLVISVEGQIENRLQSVYVKMDSMTIILILIVKVKKKKKKKKKKN